MLAYIHAVSAVLFYALGATLFAAYLLVRHKLGADLPLKWLSYMDLPSLLVGLLYGGLSIYRSLRDDTSISVILLIAIGMPVALVFVAFFILNFLPVIS